VEFAKGDLKDSMELKIGLKFDHHAYLIFENLDSVELPAVESAQDLRLNVSKAFSSFINMNKDELAKLVSRVRSLP